MTEQEILTVLKKNGPMLYTDLLNYGLKQNDSETNLNVKRLQHLKNERWISGYLKANEFIRLTPAGLSHLDSLDQEENLRKEQFAHNWKVAIFSALAGAFLSKPFWAIVEALFSLISIPKP